MLVELFLQQGFLCLVELHGGVVAVSQEGQAVGTKKLRFVLEVDQQDFTGLRLAALHSALDLRGLEQRCVGMHGDLEFAAAGLVHVIGELHQVFTVKVAGRVGGGQVPFGLGHGAGAQAQGNGGDQCELEFHGGLLVKEEGV